MGGRRAHAGRAHPTRRPPRSHRRLYRNPWQQLTGQRQFSHDDRATRVGAGRVRLLAARLRLPAGQTGAAALPLCSPQHRRTPHCSRRCRHRWPAAHPGPSRRLRWPALPHSPMVMAAARCAASAAAASVEEQGPQSPQCRCPSAWGWRCGTRSASGQRSAVRSARRHSRQTWPQHWPHQRPLRRADAAFRSVSLSCHVRGPSRAVGVADRRRAKVRIRAAIGGR